MKRGVFYAAVSVFTVPAGYGVRCSLCRRVFVGGLDLRMAMHVRFCRVVCGGCVGGST